MMALSVTVCATALTCLLYPSRRTRALARLQAVGSTRTPRPQRTGVAATIASLSAAVRNGGSVVAAFEEQAGRRFATPGLTVPRVRETLLRRSAEDEPAALVTQAAMELDMACRLSRELGCGTARCMDAVAAAWRSGQRVERARRKALSVPVATMRLLAGLPMLTVMLAEVMGVRPLAFLLGTPSGLACLGLGSACSVLGVWWMNALIRRSGLVTGRQGSDGRRVILRRRARSGLAQSPLGRAGLRSARAGRCATDDR